MALAVQLARVVADPGLALGRIAAKDLGRTGALPTHATLGAWPWVAAAGIILLALATVLAASGARRWRGLGQRYETAPGAATVLAGAGRLARSGDAATVDLEPHGWAVLGG